MLASAGLVALALALVFGLGPARDGTGTEVAPAMTVETSLSLPAPGKAADIVAEPAADVRSSSTLDGLAPREAAKAAGDPALGYSPDPKSLQEAAARLWRKSADAGKSGVAASEVEQGAKGSATNAVYRPPNPAPSPANALKLILVIDDVGNNLAQLDSFLKLPFPLTFAVLPGLPWSGEAARRIRAAGKELILHQPMEALGGQDPGPSAIYLATDAAEAAAIVRRNLDSLPGAIGLNNHEGSAVTRDPELMASIMGVAKKRGIYYLDSLTIPETATSVVAAREGIRFWERDVFLDNSPDRVSIVHYLDVGKKKAQKNGSAVMIGHVWSAQLAQTLSELYPQLVAEGFSLSTISKVMLEEVDAGSGD